MEGILVDSSVWIDFFNHSDTQASIMLKDLLDNDSEILMCPIIYQEILQGIKNDKEFENIKLILSFYSFLTTDILEITDFAIDIYRTLRKNGITIRKSMDCIIAAYSIVNKIPLFYKDRDFDNIAKIFDLQKHK